MDFHDTLLQAISTNCFVHTDRFRSGIGLLLIEPVPMFCFFQSYNPTLLVSCRIETFSSPNGDKQRIVHVLFNVEEHNLFIFAQFQTKLDKMNSFKYSGILYGTTCYYIVEVQWHRVVD